MVGSIIILVFIILIKILNVQKAFSIFIIYNFLDKGLSLVGPLQVKDIILFIFLLILLSKKRLLTENKYPLTFCSLLSIASYFLSTYFSQSPHWPFTIIKCIKYFGLPLCFYYYIAISWKLKGMQYFIKYMFLFSIFLVLYAFIELIIGTSPIVNFINEHNGTGYNLDETFRFGIKRIQTVFTHATTLGYFSVVFISFLLLFIDKNICQSLNIKQSHYWIVITGLIVTTFLSGTRSALIPLAFIFIYYLRSKIFKLKYLIVYAFLFCLILFFAKTYGGDYFDSIINSILNLNDTSIGSTTDMRDRQIEITFLYWSLAPIVGHGSGYTFETVTVMNPDMFGAESIWMPLLIDNGILGVIAYIVCYIACWKYLKKYHKAFNGMIFLLIIFFINTTTSVPGLDISFIFILVFGISALAKFSNKSIINKKSHEVFDYSRSI